MATFELEYAQEHLPELFAHAIDGTEVVIVREDGQACQLTRLAAAWDKKPAADVVEIPEDREPEIGDLVPA
ncbi:MAG TPA: hypothetical protein VN610_04765 [Bryobacteraceae bacterium]|nr:hypothetical protein [Bryobacteraceae bacterium]